MNDDYKDHPKSISEIKADRSRSSKDWTPRDTLIDVLRKLDSGSIAPLSMIIAYTDESTKCVAYSVSTPHINTVLGLLNRVSHMINTARDADN